MTSYLERAQIARAIKARVLNGGANAAAIRREASTRSVNDPGITPDDITAPEPGPRFLANRLEPAT